METFANKCSYRVAFEEVDLLFSTSQLRTMVVERGASEALWQAQRFAPLEEYAQRLLTLSSPAEEQNAPGHLEKAVSGGYLTTRLALVRRLSSSRSPRAPRPRIGLVGVPTKNRPTCVWRNLLSHAANMARHGREATTLLVDDSDSEFAAGNAMAAQSVAGAFSQEIAYIGRATRRFIVEELGRLTSIDRGLLDFSVQGLPGETFRIGGSRNLILLLAAGRLILMNDDDVIGTPGNLPKGQSTPRLRLGGDPLARHFGGQVTSERDVELADQSLLTLHEELLGRSVADLVAGKDDVDLDGLFNPFLQRLEGRHCSVLSTFIGPAGDQGTKSAAGLLYLDGEDRERLTRSERTYRTALLSRQILCGSKDWAISEHGPCLAMCLGLDVRAPLPPFPPNWRNEDGVFEVALRSLRGDGCRGYLPFVIPHVPVTPRRPSDADTWSAMVTVRLNDIFRLVVSDFGRVPWWYDAPVAFTQMGRHLVEVGTLRPPLFEEYVREAVKRISLGHIDVLERNLAGWPEAPEYWRRDVEALLVRFRQVAETGVRDFGPAHGWPEGLRLAALAISRYGELLQVWPEVLTEASKHDLLGRVLRHIGIHRQQTEGAA